MVRSFGENNGAGVRRPNGIFAIHFQVAGLAAGGWHNEQFEAAHLSGEGDPFTVWRPIGLSGIASPNGAETLLIAASCRNGVEAGDAAFARHKTDGLAVG